MNFSCPAATSSEASTTAPKQRISSVVKLEGKKYWKLVSEGFSEILLDIPKEVAEDLWRICLNTKYVSWRHTLGNLSSWIVQNTIDVFILFLIIFIGLPLAIFFEYRTRRCLKQGKMYTISGRKLVVPFEGTNLFQANEKVPLYVLEEEEEEDSSYQKHLGKDKPAQKRILLKDGTMVMLVKDPDEGMFGLEKKWVFLMPQGRLIELNWTDHRFIFCGIAPTKRPKAK